MTDASLFEKYQATRHLTELLVQGLSDADATVQPMPDASPAKWHLAHTTWFFETFVLRDKIAGYQLFDDKWPFLFNSYYETEGQRISRAHRGVLSRPSLDQIHAYRRHVDNMLLKNQSEFREATLSLIELGVHHEQQHQELLLTDILNSFWENPLKPAYRLKQREQKSVPPGTLRWFEFDGGPHRVGHHGPGFAFDAETPAHTVLLAPFALANRCVTNSEWSDFIEDGGYRNPRHWLSDGWAWVNSQTVRSPLYWSEEEGNHRRTFTFEGEQPLDPDAPVTHVSFYEADAFASWAGARLPTECEWEVASAGIDPRSGNLLDGAVAVAPKPAIGAGLQQMYGDVWEWTGSAFRPYPGFRVAAGAVGEYNGKFMSGQFVLKGGSCATPHGHVRASYRNFFYPHQRWQFCGLRLARDL